VLFIALVVSVEAWAIQRMGIINVPNAVTILFATGILCDLVREWRARENDAHLTPVWEIHQMYAVAPALRLLEGEGIRAFAKGMRLRSLLQFLAPTCPCRSASAEDVPRARSS
jgi:hypothetical protein